MMRRRRVLATLLCAALAIAGCGQPFYVVTSPGRAEIWVDGEYQGIGAVKVPTNGVIFNSYTVQARDAAGNVLAEDDVDLVPGPRSAVFGLLSLLGIIFPPLVAFLPLAILTAEPYPEQLQLRVPVQKKEQGGEHEGRETIDRPVVQIASPEPGQRVDTDAVVVTGTVRHWSGVRIVRLLSEGLEVDALPIPKNPETEVTFRLRAPLPESGNRVLRLAARGVRGDEGFEEVWVVRVVPGEPEPPPPEKVPGLEGQ